MQGDVPSRVRAAVSTMSLLNSTKRSTTPSLPQLVEKYVCGGGAVWACGVGAEFARVIALPPPRDLPGLPIGWLTSASMTKSGTYLRMRSFLSASVNQRNCSTRVFWSTS